MSIVIYLKTDGKDVWIKDTRKYGRKWRRVRDSVMADTLKDWIANAVSRM